MVNYGLENKVVLITGGRRGLGKATVEDFVAQGSKVIFSGRDVEKGQKAAQELGTDFVQFDMMDNASIEKMFAYVYEKYGRLDIFVNNAAYTEDTGKPSGDYCDDTIFRAYMTNSQGSFKCMQEAIKVMLKQGGGVIVNISSSVTVGGGINSNVYASSKSSINTMTRLASAEYAGKGIRINAVLPGLMLTESTLEYKEEHPEGYKSFVATIPVQRLADPHEVAKGVLWFSSDDASFVHGQCLSIDGNINF